MYLRGDSIGRDVETKFEVACFLLEVGIADELERSELAVFEADETASPALASRFFKDSFFARGSRGIKGGSCGSTEIDLALLFEEEAVSGLRGDEIDGACSSSRARFGAFVLEELEAIG